MKKNYLKPQISEVKMVSMSVVAASFDTGDIGQTDDEIVTNSRRNRNDWDNIWQ
ncbi:MAG: hypothetical protein IJF00_03495 [Bacteroidaceae bacterium]|nr:hypothetical protein [Bacteroidaceae bacterium]